MGYIFGVAVAIITCVELTGCAFPTDGGPVVSASDTCGTVQEMGRTLLACDSPGASCAFNEAEEPVPVDAPDGYTSGVTVDGGTAEATRFYLFTCAGGYWHGVRTVRP